MIDADDVAMIKRLAHALDPPVVAAVLERLPVVERIAPTLAGLAEGIGRDARNHRWAEIEVQVVEMRVRPHVGTVVADENGDVAYDLDSALCGGGADGAPLLGKEELDDAV